MLHPCIRQKNFAKLINAHRFWAYGISSEQHDKRLMPASEFLLNKLILMMINKCDKSQE